MLHTTSDNIECGMWNVGWCINVKCKDRLYESWNGSTGMGKKERSSIACWEGSRCIEWRKKCVGGCTRQKRYNEKVMVKFNYNVNNCIQRHWNTLKHTINALKYIISTLKYIYEYIQIHSSILKYIEIHIWILSNTLKYIEIHYKYIQIYHKYTISTFKYIQIYHEYIQIYYEWVHSQ
jgi:hypothetical protein